MPKVIGVRFKSAGKQYFFNPGTLSPVAGDAVIVETARGIEYAQTTGAPQEVDEKRVAQPLKRVLRIATDEDQRQQQLNTQKEKEARLICLKKIEEHRLDMKLVKVEYTFDRSKLIAYFTSGGRVDFRALVKDLASTFKVRIELKQIGVRDEAKMIGGLGSCGRPLCCSEFLGEFQPVSIKMAKEQSLSLNPTKISGVCGRLMCCLKYEQEHYEKTRRSLPHVGKEAITPDGRGTVVDINVLRETVRVRVAKGSESEVREYVASDVQRAHPPVPQPQPEKSRERPRPPRVQAAPREKAASAPAVDEEFIETNIEIDTSHTVADDE